MMDMYEGAQVCLYIELIYRFGLAKAMTTIWRYTREEESELKDHQAFHILPQSCLVLWPIGN